MSKHLLDVEAPGEGSGGRFWRRKQLSILTRHREFDSTAVRVECVQTELGGGRVVRAEAQADRGDGAQHVVWRREGAIGLDGRSAVWRVVGG